MEPVYAAARQSTVYASAEPYPLRTKQGFPSDVNPAAITKVPVSAQPLTSLHTPQAGFAARNIEPTALRAEAGPAIATARFSVPLRLSDGGESSFRVPSRAETEPTATDKLPGPEPSTLSSMAADGGQVQTLDSRPYFPERHQPERSWLQAAEESKPRRSTTI